MTKPFNYEHARAGAPVATRGGHDVEILKWDVRGGDCPILGIAKDLEIDMMTRWSETGQPAASYGGHMTLVMKPLGYIDDKPVFVGDELEQRDRHNESWVPRTAQPSDRDFSISRWPAPKREYPQSTMTNLEINQAIVTHDLQFVSNSATEAGRRVANAALHHAIDAGQVVPKDEATALHHIQQGTVVMREAYNVAMSDLGRATRALTRAGFVDNGAEEWKPPVNKLAAELAASIDDIDVRDRRIELLRATVARQAATIAELKADRDERDMAVAEAVRTVCRDMFADKSNNGTAIKLTAAYSRCSNLNLAAIIATVK